MPGVDPVTAIAETVGKAFDGARVWMEMMLDPEKRRLRQIEKLNDDIDKKAAKIEKLGGEIRERYK